MPKRIALRGWNIPEKGERCQIEIFKCFKIFSANTLSFKKITVFISQI